MAQVSMNAYDADVFIPEFKGLMQYGDHMNGDLRYSPDCLNVETPGGVLQPSGIIGLHESVGFTDDLTSLDVTLMCFRDSATSGTSTTYYTHYILASNGKLYSGDMSTPVIWEAMSFPTGVTSYKRNKWSWVVYEYVPEGQTDPKNVLLISNAKDGMFAIEGDTVTKVTGAPKKFAYIERYGERIWGCGATDKPDTIYYSVPYSYSDWSQNNANPASGGGEFREPTWDTDNINCLKRFGDNLIMFSAKRAWKISGTDISSIYIQEQFGNGTPCPETICVYKNLIYMFRPTDGVVCYDGISVNKLSSVSMYDSLYMLGANIAKATILDERYICYCSYTYYDERTETSYPGKIVITYNIIDNTFLASDSPEIGSFCSDSHYAVAVGRNETTHWLSIVKIGKNSWKDKTNEGYATRWTSPWITFGRKDIKKGGFDLYFTPELADTALTSVTFKFTLQTEKKAKVKNYTVLPLSAADITAGKKYKQKKLHFGGTGRMFRLIIETASGITVPWRLVGGIHIIAEIDKD